MKLFYAPEILDNNILPEEESYHCIKVLRQNSGDIISIIDGKGNLYEAEISVPDIRHTKVNIINTQKEFEKRHYNLHIAIAPTKNIDRLEWFVEKAVEIGVDCITPIKCNFSERKNVRIDRLEKIALSATKQSLKAYLPKINEMINFEDFIISHNMYPQKMIAHCYDNPQREELIKIYKPSDSALVMIGPEGDFSPEELRSAIDKGYTPISLSNSRLRTETAGIVAVNTIAIANTISYL